jgi:GT2 family glycosyltransferase
MSIIIVNWNKADLLRECLQSVSNDASGGRAEAIVVDNGSTDGSAEMVKAQFPWVTVIQSAENLGFTGGNHLGMTQARGEIVFLLNNDAFVTPDCVNNLLSVFEDKSVGIAGCVVKDAQSPERVLEAGLAIDRFGFMIPHNVNPDDPDPFYVSGCALAFRRSIADRLGVFDDRFFMFMEDVDMCWRYRLAGYRIRVAPNAVVFHRSGSSIAGGTARKGRYVTSLRRYYYRERNTLAMLLKNYSALSLAGVIPAYLAVLAAETLLALVMFRPRLAGVYLRALGWNLVQLRETLRRRARVQALRRVRDRQLPFDGRWGKLAALRSVGPPQFVE